MSTLSRLKHFFFGVPIVERHCYNCGHCSEEKLKEALQGEHPVVQHHLEIGNWNPRKKDTSPLGYCTKHNYAVALQAVSCDDWKDKD